MRPYVMARLALLVSTAPGVLPQAWATAVPDPLASTPSTAVTPGTPAPPATAAPKKGGVGKFVFGSAITLTSLTAVAVVGTQSLLTLLVVPPPPPCPTGGGSLSNALVDATSPVTVQVEGEFALGFKAHIVADGCTVATLSSSSVLHPMNQIPSHYALEDAEGQVVAQINLKNRPKLASTDLTEGGDEAANGSGENDSSSLLSTLTALFLEMTGGFHSLGNKTMSIMIDGKPQAVFEKVDGEGGVTKILIKDPKTFELLATLEKPSTIDDVLSLDIRSLPFPTYTLELTPKGRTTLVPSAPTVLDKSPEVAGSELPSKNAEAQEKTENGAKKDASKNDGPVPHELAYPDRLSANPKTSKPSSTNRSESQDGEQNSGIYEGAREFRERDAEPESTRSQERVPEETAPEENPSETYSAPPPPPRRQEPVYSAPAPQRVLPPLAPAPLQEPLFPQNQRGGYTLIPDGESSVINTPPPLYSDSPQVIIIPQNVPYRDPSSVINFPPPGYNNPSSVAPLPAPQDEGGMPYAIPKD